MLLHRLGAFFVLTSTLFYGIYALVKLAHIHNDVHGPLGTIMTALVSAIFISGLTTRYYLQNAITSNYKSAINLRKMHRVSFNHV